MTTLSAAAIEQVFNHTFSDCNTVLVGNAEEPLYLPADRHCNRHRIFYREDYVSSALHEVAHWCIAGEHRLTLVDFGYWYAPDGRTAQQQRAFEQVEVKPQALEWLFSVACGQAFAISADNLASDDIAARSASTAFVEAVAAQTRQYCLAGPPPRGDRFITALSACFGRAGTLDPSDYRAEVHLPVAEPAL